VQFASRTRQLFVRLLALVKWMNSASKVNKCGVGLLVAVVTVAVFITSKTMAFMFTLIVILATL